MIEKRSNPLVSIIVPTYNQGRFIGATLDSILEQNYRPLEILVVDGASRDETIVIVKQYAARHPELRWWSERDKGPHEAVNKGFAWARGQYAGIQSSDDIYLPGAVRTAVGELESHPDVDIVYGDGYPMDEDGRAIDEPTSWGAFSLANYLCFATFILQSSAFFRLDAARLAGGWRANYFVADVDLWHRMVFRKPALKLDVVMSAWRLHGQQRNKETERIWSSYWRMVEESEDIRRAPWRLRRAAEAGRRVLTQHYNPGDRAFLRRQLWGALLAYPPSWRAIRNKRDLLPRIGLRAAFGDRPRGPEQPDG